MSAIARLRALVAGTALLLAVLVPVAPVAATVLGFAVVFALAPLGETGAVRAGRLLLLGLVVGQFGYSVPWPAPLPPRVAVAWVLAALATLAWLATRPDPWAAARDALPEVAAPEWAVGAFAAIVAWWHAPWAGGPEHALSRLFMGWDHAGHFAMVEQLRAPTDTFGGAFGGYPRGYHALVAGVMELGVGRPAGLESEVAAYGVAHVVVIGVSLIMAAAFVLATPALRRWPVLLVPALAGLVTLYLQLDDSAQGAYYGFGGFVVSAALAAAGTLLLVTWRQGDDARHWVLWGAAVAGVFGTWTLLLAFLAPVPVAAWLARRREPGILLRLLRSLPWALPLPLLAFLVQQTPTEGLTTAGDAPGTAGTGLLAAIDRFLLLGGAIRSSSLGWPVLLAFAGLVLPIVLAIVARRRRDAEVAATVSLVAVSAVALLMSGAMLGYAQYRVGAARYYGIKVLCATTIVAGSVALVAGATLTDLAVGVRHTLARVIAGVTAVILLFAVGAPLPLGAVRLSPGAAVRADFASQRPDRRAPLARSVFAACAVLPGRGEYYLLTPGTNHEDAVRAGVWIIGCGQNWDSDQAEVLRRLLPDRAGQGAEIVLDVPTDAARILATRPKARVIVPAALAEPVRDAAGPFAADRVLTF